MNLNKDISKYNCIEKHVEKILNCFSETKYFPHHLNEKLPLILEYLRLKENRFENDIKCQKIYFNLLKKNEEIKNEMKFCKTSSLILNYKIKENNNIKYVFQMNPKLFEYLRKNKNVLLFFRIKMLDENKDFYSHQNIIFFDSINRKIHRFEVNGYNKEIITEDILIEKFVNYINKQFFEKKPFRYIKINKKNKEINFSTEENKVGFCFVICCLFFDLYYLLLKECGCEEKNENVCYQLIKQYLSKMKEKEFITLILKYNTYLQNLNEKTDFFLKNLKTSLW